jgi:predicted nucleic acid-binding protein
VLGGWIKGKSSLPNTPYPFFLRKIPGYWLFIAQVQAALNSLYDMQIRIVKGSREVVKEAIHLAYLYDVTVYDAAFVAIAENLSVPFITADDKLSQKLGKASYVHHISVFA